MALKPEQRTQKAILEWLSIQHSRIRQYTIKIDNEGRKGILGSAISEGLRPGASDLFIAWPNSKYSGLWVEIKADGWKGPRNKAEAERVKKQKEFGQMMMDIGYHFEFVIGVDEGINAIHKYALIV